MRVVCTFASLPRRRYHAGASAYFVLLVACASPPPGPPTDQSATGAQPADRVFEDVAAETGIDFRHFDGASGRYHLPEIMGAGAALFDYDGDGDLDVYLVQGTTLDTEADGSGSASAAGQTPRNRLFENDLADSGVLRFRDVTDAAGVGDDGYGMGVAVGDYDNDGHIDLYVTCVGSNVLYRNNGDGTFTNVTASAGADDQRWSTSASFLDYDRDGDLDLFVANYVDFAPLNYRDCYDEDGSRAYCAPAVHRPVPDRLFRNDGDGTFTDVSGSAGVLGAFGRGLGVLATDLDGDTWVDIYVANDADANQLWRNNGDGTFTDIALLSGTAYNAEGRPEAGMGVTAADFDRDGDLDLFVSHLTRESNTLYRAESPGVFRDVTSRFDLATNSLLYTGFGCAWFDYDNDGWLDLFVANGAVEAQPSVPNRFGQRNQLYRGTGGGRLEEVPGDPGSPLELIEVSRGAAFGDVDNDGDIDIVVTNNNGPARLYLNTVGAEKRSLLVRLEGDGINRHVTGARIAVFVGSQDPLWRHLQPGGSYLSASDRRVHFGLGDATLDEVNQIGVIWPDGRRETWDPAAVSRRELTLREGTGIAWPESS